MRGGGDGFQKRGSSRGEDRGVDGARSGRDEEIEQIPDEKSCLRLWESRCSRAFRGREFRKLK